VEKPSLARPTTFGSLLAGLALFGSLATAAPAQGAAARHADRAAARAVRPHRSAAHHGEGRALRRPAHHAEPELPAMRVTTGAGFDTCWAPPLASMQAWHEGSAYRAVGIYIGGRNRACSGGNLTSSWVSAATTQGWSLIPVYVGLQAPCVTQKGMATMQQADAVQEGTSEADDASARARAYGLATGSPVYFDLEAFKANNPSCVSVVLAYIDAWTRELHAEGYYSGVYGSAASGITTLALAVQSQPSFTGPDAIWIARWDQQARTSDGSVPGNLWPGHQRIKQFQGGHQERHGGVTLVVDSDYVDGPVAIVS
jgi:Domain of unknown function (DUF1906)